MADNRAKDKFDEALTALVDGVTGLLDSDKFTRWLKTAATFHKYSFGNQLLIGVQRPDATQVAGYKTWLKLGRKVKKGEKGIMILVPMRSKSKLDEETGEEKPGHLFFGTGHVFDVEQTEGEALPNLGYQHTTGDSLAHILEAAIKVAQDEGLTVDFSEEKRAGKASGYLDPKAKRIWVRESSEVNGKATTMLHELGHWFDPKLNGEDADPFEYFNHRGERETVAEAASYIAAYHFGLETGGETFAYVAGWAQDIKVLKARLGEVSKLAGILIEKIEGALSVEEQSEAA